MPAKPCANKIPGFSTHDSIPTMTNASKHLAENFEHDIFGQSRRNEQVGRLFESLDLDVHLPYSTSKCIALDPGACNTGIAHQTLIHLEMKRRTVVLYRVPENPNLLNKVFQITPPNYDKVIESG